MGETIILLRRLRTGSVVLLVVALGAVAMAFVSAGAMPNALFLTAATALTTIVAALHVATWIMAWMSHRRLRIVMEFLEYDSAPGFCTDEIGAIFAQNRAATERFGVQDGGTMTRALEPLFANPDAVVHRLRSAAMDEKAAREDVVTRRGHVRVAVHRIPGGHLWRLEDLVDRPPRSADGIGLPMLTFGPSGTILYMNEVLRTAAGRRVKRLRDLFEEVPLINGGLNRLVAKNGAESVRVVLSAPVNGRQEVFVLPSGDSTDGQVALDALPVALLRLDSSGRVAFANRLARELLPATNTGTESRLAALVEGLGRSVREWVSEAAAGRGLYRAEVVRVTGAEVETYLQITLGRPLGDGEGGLLAVLNDATELKTLEAQFVQSQKMQAIGQLAGGVAHDFNNLLTAISGHCDLLMLRHGEGDEDHADLTQITQNANRAAALVGQLLAFSRKQTLEMRPIDLRDTLGDLAHLLNRLVGDRVILRLEHDPALIPIRGDRRQLEQVLMNLVVNARDAMPDGGEILIETECRYLPAPLLRDRVSVPSGQYVIVSVTDEGTGITIDNLSRIFEPFFTTKRPGEGTGLGLSMAYGIVKQSGGYIFADSTPGQGTRFSLYFPALTDAAEAELVEAPDLPDATAAPVDRALDQLPVPEPVSDLTQTIKTSTQHSSDGARDDGEVGNDPDGSISTISDSTFDGEVVDAPKPAEGEGEMSAMLRGVLETSRSDPLSHPTPPDAVDEPKTLPSAGKQAESKVSSDVDKCDLQPTKPVVLLVEDEAPVRAFASRALRLRGYEVMEAEDAESALAQLSDRNLLVDLFVTDVMMPGLDGPSWVREAMKMRPDVRTVFMSGYTQDALSETSVPVPNSVFLPKPFSLSDLTRTVERALL